MKRPPSTVLSAIDNWPDWLCPSSPSFFLSCLGEKRKAKCSHLACPPWETNVAQRVFKSEGREGREKTSERRGRTSGEEGRGRKENPPLHIFFGPHHPSLSSSLLFRSFHSSFLILHSSNTLDTPSSFLSNCPTVTRAKPCQRQPLLPRNQLC